MDGDKHFPLTRLHELSYLNSHILLTDYPGIGSFIFLECWTLDVFCYLESVPRSSFKGICKRKENNFFFVALPQLLLFV